MEITKRLDQIDPQYLPLVEQLFAHAIDAPASAVLVLRVESTIPQVETVGEGQSQDEATGGRIPAYLNVLEGFSDQELAEFEADLRNNPVRFRSTET